MEYPQDNNTIPLQGGFNFTPWCDALKCRVRMRIERGLRVPTSGIITDLDTGKRYEVRPRPCGLPHCNCDASITELTTLAEVFGHE